MKLLLYFLLFGYIHYNYGNTLRHVSKSEHQTYDNQSLIIKGTVSEIKRYPMMAELAIKFRQKASLCGSTILNDKTLLTAGHCFLVYEHFETMRATIGSVFPSQGLWYYTSNYTIHPSFDPPQPEYDIAVARTNSKMYIDGVATRPVVLASVTRIVAASVTILGWGYTKPGERNSRSDVLREADIPVVSAAVCREAYKDHKNTPILTKNMFCAGEMKKDSAEACHGDSGGPALIRLNKKDIQVGVISKAPDCGVNGIPSIYTNVASMRAWITAEMMVA